MNPTARDKVLIALLPAILIVAVYGWGFSRGLQSDIDQLREEVEQAGEEPVTELDVQIEERLAVGLRRDGAELQERERVLRAELAELARPLRNEAGSTGSSQALTGLLSRHGLRTVRQQPVENRDLSQLAPTLAETVARLEARIGPLNRRIFQVQVSGTYPQVVGALQEMSDEDGSLVGVSLEMGEAPLGQELREWTLLVWM